MTRVADVDPAARAQRLALRHVRSELHNEPERILATITTRQPLLTAIIERSPEGGPGLSLFRTVAEQRQHYEQNRSEMHAIAAEIYSSVGAPWYAFVHGDMTVRVLAGGQQRRNEWVGLFPIRPDEDAIGGEIGLSWPATAARGDDHGVPSTVRTEWTRTFERRQDALRANDAAAIADCYAAEALVAAGAIDDVPATGLNGAAAVRRFHADALSSCTVEEVETVTRITDRWFLFAETRTVLIDRDGARGVRRTAQILVPDEAGRIVVDLGYSVTADGDNVVA